MIDKFLTFKGQENVRQENTVVYLPIYMAMFLEQQTSMDIAYKVDLSGL